MVVKVKNDTTSTQTWVGQQIEAGAYYTLENFEIQTWANNSTFLTAVGNGQAVINDGSEDITDVANGINWLQGNSKRTLDDKQFVHETSRPIGTTTGFTSQGDSTCEWDGTVCTTVWGGSLLKVEHAAEDATQQTAYIDLNVKENRTYMHEGYMIWKNADFDTVCLDMVPTLTQYSADESTNYNLSNGYLITPASPGTGAIKVDATDMRLVEMPPARDDGERPTAYWDADYDTTTHTFSNITPNYTGEGQYNMFGTEVSLVRFVNRALMLNDGFLCLQTADCDEIGHGMRLKLTACTNGDTTHAWKAAFLLTLDREKLA